MGSFLDLLDFPVNRFVAEFVGEPPMVFLPVERTDTNLILVEGVPIPLSRPLAATLRTTKDTKLVLGVRPNDISVVSPAAERLNGVVTLVQPQGSHSIVVVSTPAGPATAIVSSDRRPVPGVTIGLLFASERLHLFDSTARSLLHHREGNSG
jgi:multiple sugar transport system ATP-binding protein